MRTLLIILLGLCYFSVEAKIYHVDVDGNDRNTGSFSSPWATIQHSAQVAGAGDTVYVNEGKYKEKISFPNSGTATAYITFIGIGKVTVEGNSDIMVWDGIFNINHKSYIRIINFSLLNSYWFGIHLEDCHNIYIENNFTGNTGASGISVWHSSQVYTSYNVVNKACYQSLSSSASQECITFSAVSDFEIHHNEVYESGGSNNGGEGIDAKENCNNGKIYNNVVHDLERLGIYVDSWDKSLKNIEVFNNRIYDCNEGIVLSSEAGGVLSNIKVYNNLCYNNRAFGITISNYGTDGPRKDIWVMNNTVCYNGFGDDNENWGGGIIIYTQHVEGFYLFNNIVAGNDAMQVSNYGKVTALSVHHNLIYGYKGNDWTGEIMGSFVINANPLFSKDDYTFIPSEHSPALNAGVAGDAPLFDYNNRNRNLQEGPTVGAIEIKY